MQRISTEFLIIVTYFVHLACSGNVTPETPEQGVKYIQS